jgi:hypothetical protein
LLDKFLVLQQDQAGANCRQGAAENTQVEVRTGGAGMSKNDIPEQLKYRDGDNYLQRHQYQPGNPAIEPAFVPWLNFDANTGRQFPLAKFRLLHGLPSSPVGINPTCPTFLVP